MHLVRVSSLILGLATVSATAQEIDLYLSAAAQDAMSRDAMTAYGQADEAFSSLQTQLGLERLILAADLSPDVIDLQLLAAGAILEHCEDCDDPAAFLAQAEAIFQRVIDNPDTGRMDMRRAERDLEIVRDMIEEHSGSAVAQSAAPNRVDREEATGTQAVMDEGSLRLGRPEDGDLGPQDMVQASGSHFDRHTFVAEPAVSYVFRIESDAFAPAIMVSDGRGGTASADGRSHADLRLATPTGGELAVIASSQRPGVSGDYTVSVYREGEEPPIVEAQPPAIVAQPANQGLPAQFPQPQAANQQPVFQGGTVTAPGQAPVQVGPDGQPVAGQQIPPQPNQFQQASNAQAPAPQPREGVTVIEVGTPVSGQLSRSDVLRQDGQFQDAFVFGAAAGQGYSVHLTADYDCFLEVYTPGGQFYENDDFGAFEVSHVEFQAQSPGEVAVAVTSFGSGVTGNYELLVTSRDMAGGAPPGIAMPLEPGILVTGFLDVEDPTYPPQNWHYDEYRYTAQQGEELTISMNSTSTVDPYLMVEDAGGYRVDNDDMAMADSGGRDPFGFGGLGGFSLDAEINFVASETGEVRIIATSYSGGDRGQYSIVLESAGGAIPTATAEPATPEAAPEATPAP